MTNHDRIRRMRDEGLLTEAQAEMLQASLSPLRENSPQPPARRSAPLAAMAILAGSVLLLVAGTVLLGGEPAPAAGIVDAAQSLNTIEGKGAMNKTLSNLVSGSLLLLPLVLAVVAFAWLHNGLVNDEEKVYTAWSQVESNLQRRADLVPDLVEAVSRYLEHERSTLDDVVAQRGAGLDRLAAAMDEVIETGSAVSSGDAPAPLDDEAALAELARTQQALGGSLRNLVAVAESYPSLRSADQFLTLQAQLEGTENRINVARMAFNEAVGTYNSAIRRMPGSLVAGLGNFSRKAYFQADDQATSQSIDFD